jgi:hypothetical protein
MSRYENAPWRIFNFLVVAGIVALVVWGAWRVLGWVGLLVCLPLGAWFASRAIVHGGEGFFTWLFNLPLARWHGSYYQFDNEQIRVHPHGERVLFVAADVLRATGIAPSPASWLAAHADETIDIPNSRLQGFGMHQIRRLVDEHPASQAGRFMTWAEREVVGPFEKKRRG